MRGLGGRRALVVLAALGCLGIERMSSSIVLTQPVSGCLGCLPVSGSVSGCAPGRVVASADADPLAFYVSVGPSFVGPRPLITGSKGSFNAPDSTILVHALSRFAPSSRLGKTRSSKVSASPPHLNALIVSLHSPHHDILLSNPTANLHHSLTSLGFHACEADTTTYRLRNEENKVHPNEVLKPSCHYTHAIIKIIK